MTSADPARVAVAPVPKFWPMIVSVFCAKSAWASLTTTGAPPGGGAAARTALAAARTTASAEKNPRIGRFSLVFIFASFLWSGFLGAAWRLRFALSQQHF